MRHAARLFTFAFFSCLAGTAQAQTPNVQPNFDQYPSFIEMSSQLQDGTSFVLRCGYAQSGTNVAADPGYMEISVLNQSSGSYMRYQRIDAVLVVTVPAPGVQGRFLLEAVDPTGRISAKNCSVNALADTIQNCTTVQPFMPAEQIASQDANAANQCGTFFAKATAQIDHVTYNTLKTETFKNALRQKVAILEAP